MIITLFSFFYLLKFKINTETVDKKKDKTKVTEISKRDNDEIKDNYIYI